jgi:hypothetical protein
MNMTQLLSSASFIERTVKGHIPLTKAFWLLFVPLVLMLYLTYIASFWALLSLNHMADIAIFALSFSSIALLLIAIGSFIVWQNSANTTTSAWKYLARIFVVAYLLWYSFRTVGLWLVLGSHVI